MPTIVHFELPTDDLERAKKFYTELFGWKMEKMDDPSTGMEYWIINTTDDKDNKGVSGGMMKRQNPQQQGVTNYIDVNSVEEYSAKIEKLGGKIIVPKMPIVGMGYFAVCLDTENNKFGIWETSSEAK